MEVMFDPNTHTHTAAVSIYRMKKRRKKREEESTRSVSSPDISLEPFVLTNLSSRTCFDLESEAASTHQKAGGLLSLPLDPHMNRL